MSILEQIRDLADLDKPAPGLTTQDRLAKILRLVEQELTQPQVGAAANEGIGYVAGALPLLDCWSSASAQGLPVPADGVPGCIPAWPSTKLLRERLRSLPISAERKAPGWQTWWCQICRESYRVYYQTESERMPPKCASCGTEAIPIGFELAWTGDSQQSQEQ